MSEVSFCVECRKAVPKGVALCKECYESEHPTYVVEPKKTDASTDKSIPRGGLK